jgi:uncharacterized repeat protein (TIGR03943 family)
MRLDWTRVLRGLGLLAWAVFFDWLWVSGRGSLYVGPRTEWVLVFGAIALSTVAVIYLAGVVVREPVQPPRAIEVGRLGVIVAPIILAAMAPAVTLGAQAVGQKRGADGRALAKRLSTDGGQPVRLYELAVAKASADFARARGIKVGMKVEFDGFVSKSKGRVIELSRFMASCCPADALPYSIDVELPQGVRAPPADQWVWVSGEVGPKRQSIRAVAVDEIEQPDDVYG